jgi:hypothetical protein
MNGDFPLSLGQPPLKDYYATFLHEQDGTSEENNFLPKATQPA